jgi:hypothetical protein
MPHYYFDASYPEEFVINPRLFLDFEGDNEDYDGQGKTAQQETDDTMRMLVGAIIYFFIVLAVFIGVVAVILI